MGGLNVGRVVIEIVQRGSALAFGMRRDDLTQPMAPACARRIVLVGLQQNRHDDQVPSTSISVIGQGIPRLEFLDGDPVRLGDGVSVSPRTTVYSVVSPVCSKPQPPISQSATISPSRCSPVRLLRCYRPAGCLHSRRWYGSSTRRP